MVLNPGSSSDRPIAIADSRHDLQENGISETRLRQRAARPLSCPARCRRPCGPTRLRVTLARPRPRRPMRRWPLRPRSVPRLRPPFSFAPLPRRSGCAPDFRHRGGTLAVPVTFGGNRTSAGANHALRILSGGVIAALSPARKCSHHRAARRPPTLGLAFGQGAVAGLSRLEQGISRDRKASSPASSFPG